jgi:hypothetical protein
MKRFSRRGILGLVLPAVLAAGGCGRRGEVHGTVTYRDQPLPAGTVTFLDEGGQAVGSAPITAGRYAVGPLPVGPLKVIVITSPPPTGKSTQQVPPPKGKSPGKAVPVVVIPAKYGVPEQSGLTWTVRPGAQEYNIPLQ